MDTGCCSFDPSLTLDAAARIRHHRTIQGRTPPRPAEGGARRPPDRDRHRVVPHRLAHPGYERPADAGTSHGVAGAAVQPVPDAAERGAARRERGRRRRGRGRAGLGAGLHLVEPGTGHRGRARPRSPAAPGRARPRGADQRDADSVAADRRQRHRPGPGDPDRGRRGPVRRPGPVAAAGPARRGGDQGTRPRDGRPARHDGRGPAPYALSRRSTGWPARGPSARNSAGSTARSATPRTASG
jgi:hypothetical protein